MMHFQFRSNVAILHVFYKDRTGVRYKTDIRFGIEDFICNNKTTQFIIIINLFLNQQNLKCFFYCFSAAMGGLLSLGLGMSFISIVELIYFMFLRGFCYSRFAPSLNETIDLKENKRTEAAPISYRKNSNNVNNV